MMSLNKAGQITGSPGCMPETSCNEPVHQPISSDEMSESPSEPSGAPAGGPAPVDPRVVGPLDLRIREAPTFIERQQAGRGGRPTEDAVTALPAGVVRELGLWTHKGPLLDVAVLSAMAYRYRLSRMPDTTWMRSVLEEEWVREDAELAATLDLQPGEVWVSRERVARDLRQRWAFADPRGDAFGLSTGSSSGSWKRFFENVRNAFRRLEDAGHIRRLRDVQRTGKQNATMGSVFTLDGTPVGERADRLYDLPAPRALVLHPEGPDAALAALLDGARDDDPVPAVDLVGAAMVGFAAHRRAGGAASVAALRAASPVVAAKEYNYSEVRSSLAGGQRVVQTDRWTRKQARLGPGDDQGPYAERHVSVGAWRKLHAGKGRDGRPCMAPWLVLDFDRGDDVEESLEAAQRAVRELLHLGVEPGALVCAYTGGRGFHVHVPTGAFGSPVFRNAGDGRAVLKAIVLALVDEHVDAAPLSPVHLVRAVGSGYYEPPEGMFEAEARVLPPTRFKQAIPTERFLTMTVAEAVAAGETFEATALPDPRGTRPVATFMSELAQAACPPLRYVAAQSSGKTYAVRAVEEGVPEGERNQAAFVMATYYFDQMAMTDREAWKALCDWNRKNRPPLDRGELARVLVNAEKTVYEKASRR